MDLTNNLCLKVMIGEEAFYYLYDEDTTTEKPASSLAETAVIALKLSQKVLDLYKAVSPYITS